MTFLTVIVVFVAWFMFQHVLFEESETPLEVVWTIVPAIVLVVLSLFD